MRLDGRRESTNVDDRRRMSGGTKAGMGIGGVIIVALIAYFTGGNPLEALLSAGMESMTTNTGNYEPTAAEDELAAFSKKIFAGTEDVWTQKFKQMGKTYVAPKLVLFHGSVRSGCGSATSSTGPFYCSADQCVYLDLDFFMSMRKQIGADGDFAYAYVIAHEVGHHVQYLLGTLDQAHSAMSRYGNNSARSNQISVRLELQADFYAGVWAYNDNKMFNSLEEGDVEEGLNAASKIGDDYLQKKAQGYEVPESFNHGRSEQRMRWLKRGITTGNIQNGDTFSVDYDQL